MSVGTASTSQVAVLGARGRASLAPARASEVRRGARLAAFGALALYGTIKWSSLMTGQLGRLLGLFVLAMLLAAGRPAIARRSRIAAALATIVALIAVFPLCGIPLSWVLNLRIAVTARAIGNGLSALPQVLVPYSGANPRIAWVMVLGAAVLLFDAALLVAFAPGRMNEWRRAAAALPLIALAVVPATLIRPEFPYLDGAVLFGLLVAFMWCEQIGSRRVGGALALGAVAAIAAMFVAPAIDQHKPWFNYRALAGSLSPTPVDAFDWSQSYGPIDWPRNGHVVLAIAARQKEYWKTENLDTFNGIGWSFGAVANAQSIPRLYASAINEWTQTISVTVKDMRSQDVIGAGDSLTAPDLPQGLGPQTSPGTWTAGSQLVPGQNYDLTVYAPQPSDGQLAAAGADYAGLAPGYRAVELPPAAGTPSPSSNFLTGEKPSGDQPVLVFPGFRSGGPITSSGGPRRVSATELIAGSRYYGPIYALAQQLARGASTPLEFVQAVERHLAQGYTYNENPPRSAYPLYTFLFSSHRGYCQQFAGAMALLLRMGGVPARVAVGFTHGRFDSKSGQWLVTDYDAHAWVEAWFPHYGWVSFDPTPGVDPALANNPPAAPGALAASGAPAAALSASKQHRGAHSASRHQRGSAGGRGPHHAGFIASDGVVWIAALVGVISLGLLLAATRPLRSSEAMVAELEGALKRIGRPVPGGATLTWLERRVGGSSDAAAYIRALRMARFGGGARLPSPGERRALRRQLRLGLGPLGSLLAAWALPPRWVAPRGVDRRRWRWSRTPPSGSHDA